MSSDSRQSSDNTRDESIREDRRQADKFFQNLESAVPFGKYIPKPEGDMYEKLLAPLLERDKMRCDAWKDEVQNLLIFAGLFSAVVTAFLVESYKGLQSDPNDTMISLLSRIADHLDPPWNTSTLTISPQNLISSFEPTPSSIRVNILWFISLVLSLTTVLVGIISLQWLREHQQFDNFHQSELKFAIFNLRAESLARWYVPQVFDAMPLALQASLVLFFVGIIDFLLALHREVATPVIVVTGLAFLFLLATTLLPAFQAYTLRFPFLLQVNNEAPVPIPFKSPQSNLIRRLSSFSKHIFFLSACIFAPFYLLFVAFPSHASKFIQQIFVERRVNMYTWAPFLKQIRYTWSKHLDFPPFHIYWTESGTWTSSDERWPRMRTQYASLLHECDEREIRIDRRTHGTGIWDLTMWIPNVYDCSRGFRTILQQTGNVDQVYRVGRCGEEFSARYLISLRDFTNQLTVPLRPSIRPSIIRSKSRALEFLLRLKGRPYKYDKNHLVWLKYNDDSVDFGVLRTLHRRAVLSSMLNCFRRDADDGTRHLRLAWTECQLSVMKHLLINHRTMIFSGYLDDDLAIFKLFSEHKSIFVPDLSRQWTSLLQEFIMRTATASGSLEYTKMLKRVPTSKFLNPEALHTVIWEIVALQSLEDALSTMHLFAERLLGIASEASETRSFHWPDFFAFTTCCYLLAWLNKGRDVCRHDPPEQAIELRDTLNAYISALGRTSNKSEDLQKLRHRVKHIFGIIAKRFGEVYPAYAVNSRPHSSIPATDPAWQRLRLRSEQDDRGRSLSVTPLPGKYT